MSAKLTPTMLEKLRAVSRYELRNYKPPNEPYYSSYVSKPGIKTLITRGLIVEVSRAETKKGTEAQYRITPAGRAVLAESPVTHHSEWLAREALAPLLRLVSEIGSRPWLITALKECEAIYYGGKKQSADRD